MLDPSRRSNDEAGRAQDRRSLRRLHLCLSTNSGLEQDFNSLDAAPGKSTVPGCDRRDG